jgi:hypothetical protein
MKRFYIFWFFFCAGWGYLTTTFPPDMAPPISRLPATVVLGAISAMMLLAIELWRGSKLSRPSLGLLPWNQPVGLILFVALTFLFSGLWGVLFASVSPSGVIEVPIYVLSLSGGALLGLLGCFRVFPSRFQA